MKLPSEWRLGCGCLIKPDVPGSPAERFDTTVVVHIVCEIVEYCSQHEAVRLPKVARRIQPEPMWED